MGSLNFKRVGNSTKTNSKTKKKQFKEVFRDTYEQDGLKTKKFRKPRAKVASTALDVDAYLTEEVWDDWIELD